MGLVVTVPPAVEPVSVAEMKAHLRVDVSDDDDLIGFFIQTARERVEADSDHKLISQTLDLFLDRFPIGYFGPARAGLWSYGSGGVDYPAIELQPPVQSIVAVTYIAPGGGTVTLDPSQYRLDASAHPARLTPALAASWPATAPETDAVDVKFVAGFGATASVVPARLRQAVRLLVGHYYNNREEVLSGARLIAIEIPEGFDDLVRGFKPPLVG